MKVDILPEERGLIEAVEKRSGQDLSDCIQCTKCSGICPFSTYMDYSPNQILEMIIHGIKKPLLQSKSIQTCIGCATCEANCPSEVEMYEIMQALRDMAKEEGVESREKDIALFNDIFLDAVEKYGKSHEVGLMIRLNIAKKQYLKDMQLGPKMFIKGMVGVGDVFPHKIKNRSEVEKIFKNVRKERGQI
ncbi:4Fe-4S dicluster domain-containing protein [Selenihalanaerobacter shriftii]|uniref:Heterodisulfide reductase subunit C n=1 Tax=Selenihalanaerobacter shriftii TaxID=142842 RepID=A0A1T4QC12_9FIRM|nr:4Fe-4S dicluster domain-containing protein [Selenihalanaerobacter shriftii]SKA01167.1 heterodisulfide reductase subunit C [Selenihalanaerobacter shriftii]